MLCYWSLVPMFIVVMIAFAFIFKLVCIGSQCMLCCSSITVIDILIWQLCMEALSMHILPHFNQVCCFLNVGVYAPS